MSIILLACMNKYLEFFSLKYGIYLTLNNVRIYMQKHFTNISFLTFDIQKMYNV